MQDASHCRISVLRCRHVKVNGCGNEFSARATSDASPIHVGLNRASNVYAPVVQQSGQTSA